VKLGLNLGKFAGLVLPSHSDRSVVGVVRTLDEVVAAVWWAASEPPAEQA